MKDEPAYMLAARANVKDGAPSSAVVVSGLLQRIARLERDLAEANRPKDDGAAWPVPKRPPF